MVSGDFAAPAVSRIEHGAQRPVESEAEIVGFVDQQGWMLAVNHMVDAGRGDAVGFEGTRAHGLQQVEQRGLAAAANRARHHQPRRHGEALVDEGVGDPQRHGDELARCHFNVAPQQMMHEVKRIDGGIGRPMIGPIGPRL